MGFKSVLKYSIDNTTHKWAVPFYMLKGMYYLLLKKILPDGTLRVRAFNGATIVLLKNNSFTSAFTYAEIPELIDIKFLRQHIYPNSVFLDIGANVGAYSMMMLDVTNKIYAFEPHPVTFKQLEKNNQVNGNKILLVNKGLGDEEAVLPFTNQQSETNHIVKETLNAAAIISVPVTTLDAFAEINLCKNDRYLLKIDVEGFEDEVLKGGNYFFNNYKIDALVIETDNTRRKEMIAFFNSNGYVCDFSEKSNNIRACKKRS